jgi:hypothetical protein
MPFGLMPEPLLIFMRTCLRNLDYHQVHSVERPLDYGAVFSGRVSGVRIVVEDRHTQGCIEMNPHRKPLGGALVAAAISAIGIAFLSGCFYPFLLRLWSVSAATAVRPSYNDAGFMVLLNFGLITAMVALPVTLALTCGVGLPLFRLWMRRGYSSVAAYIGGGIIIAMVGALIIATAHFLADFLVDSNFLFAMLIIGVSGPVAGFVVWYVLQRSSQEHAK